MDYPGDKRGVQFMGVPNMDSLFHGQSIYKWMIWGYPHDLGNPQMAKKCFFFPVQTPHCQDGAHLFGAKDVDYNPNATRQRNELR